MYDTTCELTQKRSNNATYCWS